MDSGNNSGSMQSSSGGEEEYNSGAETVLQPFLNPSSAAATHFGALSSNLHHQPSLLGHPGSLFDPSPNLFHAFSHSPPNTNPTSSLMLNLDMVRPQGLRSDPNCTTNDVLANSGLPSSSSSGHSILGAHQGQQGPRPSMQSSRSATNNGARSSSQDQIRVVTKNPKKRTRASRRAPTTVLTTDTSNFRAMVQEFTGIPAPPFSASPYSRRLDLFGGSGLRSGPLEPMGSLYPLRPLAQKVHPQSPFTSSSLLNNSMVDATNIAVSTSANNTISPTNFQLPSDLGLSSKQPHQSMMNMQNQMLSFQSLLQPQSLHPSLNVPGLGVKSQAAGGLPLPSLEELGMSQGNVNANLPGLLPGHHHDGEVRLDDGDHGHQGTHLRSLGENYVSSSSQRVNNNSCKLNYSSSSLDFHRDKGIENVPSRGTEGTVDSWICPSE